MLFNLKYLIYLFYIEISLSARTCQSDEVHALILARGGSKGIKDKNLVDIGGLSLLARTIRNIQESGVFLYIWVSTDSERIADEAIKCSKCKDLSIFHHSCKSLFYQNIPDDALVHRRPALYAQDETSSLESVKEFLGMHKTISRFALFQCTSVFLKQRYIVEAFERFKQSDCVFAVTRSHKLRWQKINEKVISLNFNPKHRPRRQDWDGEFVETGMFYFSSSSLIQQDAFQNERCSVVEVDAKDSLELDTQSDVRLARCLIQIDQMA